LRFAERDESNRLQIFDEVGSFQSQDKDKLYSLIAVRMHRETTLSIKAISRTRASGNLKHGERAVA